MAIRLAHTQKDVAAAFRVMRQLRPLLTLTDFKPRVQRLQSQGYHLIVHEIDGAVNAVAGFWIRESLAWGKHLYLDDLVTDETVRSTGCGQKIFDWLILHAKEHGCQELHLDSRVQRFGAHRFYLRNRMDIGAHHFSITL